LGGFGSMPLSFEANAGQMDPAVKFLARGPGYAVYVTPGETVLALRKHSSREQGAGRRAKKSEEDNIEHPTSNAEHRRVEPGSRTSFLRIGLVGGNSNPNVRAIDPQATEINYLIGSDPSAW